jgi:hypothetical protein
VRRWGLCCRRIHDEEKGYYADGEDAYDMRKYFKKQKQELEGAFSKLSLKGKEGAEQAEERP